MILGIGSDLVDIRRIEQSLERFGARFVDRLFTEAEQQRAERMVGPRRNAGRAAVYAKRFAAKEAGAKALGTGFGRGVGWRDLGVINHADGRPVLEVTGGALERLNEMTPPGMIAQVHLTMTDEYPLAQAFVIISAVPRDIISAVPRDIINAVPRDGPAAAVPITHPSDTAVPT
jgi:holo-[acyl-carrier protein] synthase